MELDKLRAEDFAPHLNTTFRLLRGDEKPLELELIEVNDRSESLENAYTFSLIFRGGPHFFMQQHTAPLEHDQLGRLDIFLVPVSREPDGFRYEAVFNRPRE